ncbi:hypothetical protein LCM20_09705 [Halobacillus litoralis]|uniref:hypothetical protein n=1 Tax=Halobacillus litoralis TaxID=45668 RepID=UPI001CD21E37|nr:hypothetical protein [Halobacillus litoralis]MCA0970865.1 hypothetical protein [Halobacillus litoralis]
MRQHFDKTVVQELVKEWLKWSTWLFISMLTIRAIFWIFDAGGENTGVIDHFAYFMNDAGDIFMLIVGILTVYTFLRYYTEHGLTRRTYFIGGVVASLLTTAGIGIITFLLTFVEKGVLSMVGMSYPTYVEPQSAGYWIGFILMFLVTSWFYYLLGWFIGHAFYRYNWLVGMLATGISLILLFIEGIVTGETVMVFGLTLEVLSQSVIVSVLILTLISVVLAGVNYRLVKDIRVKMK